MILSTIPKLLISSTDVVKSLKFSGYVPWIISIKKSVIFSIKGWKYSTSFCTKYLNIECFELLCLIFNNTKVGILLMKGINKFLSLTKRETFPILLS